MKYIVRIQLILAIIIMTICINAFAQPPVIIERLQYYQTPQIWPGNPDPRHIAPIYYNLEYRHTVNVWVHVPQPGVTVSGIEGIFKRISPAPVQYFNFLAWWTIIDNVSLNWDSIPGMVLMSGTKDIAGFLDQPGNFVYRFGAVDLLPINATLEQAWNNMGRTGEYAEDNVSFPHSYLLPDAEVHLSLACPRNWLPVIDGYIDGSGHPNHTDFKVPFKAYFTSYDSTRPRSYNLCWVLQDISWYEGQAMNYVGSSEGNIPLADSAEERGGGPTNPPRWQLADLMILDRYNDTHRWSCGYDTVRKAFLAFSKQSYSAGDTASIIVTCYDFGAHGNIYMEVQADTNGPFMNMTSYMEADSQWKAYTTIPIDEDGDYFWDKDKLADYWEATMVADTLSPDTSILQLFPEQDEDAYIDGVLPSDPGDYLNVFEEYRGFMCKGRHVRTSPWRKDFFVYSGLNDSLNYFTGVGFAVKIGPDCCHQIDTVEMKSYFPPTPYHPISVDRRSVNWLNDRIDSVLCPSAILLKNTTFDSLSPDTNMLGISYFLTNYYSIPTTTVLGYIFTKRIMWKSPPSHNSFTPDLPQDSLGQLNVEGHEIGHMVNFGENSSRTSIMGPSMGDWIHVPNTYEQVDIDSFLVKPRH